MSVNREDWNWYAGQDEEYMTGPFDTREAAIEALDGEGGHITEARQVSLRLSRFVNVDRMVEDALEAMDEDWSYDSYVVEQTQESGPVQQLEPLILQVIEDWQTLNKVKFMPYLFTHQRNGDWIKPDGE